MARCGQTGGRSVRRVPPGAVTRRLRELPAGRRRHRSQRRGRAGCRGPVRRAGVSAGSKRRAPRSWSGLPGRGATGPGDSDAGVYVSGSVPPSGSNGAPDGAVQATIAWYRARLLDGRGPGAGPAEIDRLTRARPQLGGEPTPRHLETVAWHSAAAREDAAAMAVDLATTRDRLISDVQAIRDRVSPARVLGRQGRRLRETAAAALGVRGGGPRARVAVCAGVVLVVAVTAVVLRSGRRLPVRRQAPDARRRAVHRRAA